MEKGKPWGFFISIDLFNCDREKITSKEYIKQYIEELLPIIDMKPYGEPIIERFGEDDLNGVSAIQMLMTSNLAIHCREDNGHTDCFIDLFSCKQFDKQMTLTFSIAFFNAKGVNFQYRER
jgi:S-adenosylmethionine decarboxylase